MKILNGPLIKINGQDGGRVTAISYRRLDDNMPTYAGHFYPPARLVTTITWMGSGVPTPGTGALSLISNSIRINTVFVPVSYDADYRDGTEFYTLEVLAPDGIFDGCELFEEAVL